MKIEIQNIIQENEGLIYDVASKFYNVEFDDLYQLGVLGLLKAYRMYKNTSKAKFTTYAYKYVFGEMYQAISNSRTIKTGRDVLKQYREIMKAKEFLCQQLHKEVSNLEVALYLNQDESIVENVISHFDTPLSLDDIIIDRLKSDNLEQKNIDDNICLKEAIAKLDNKEQDIIKYRYYQDKTQSETAALLGLTQVMVSRYEQQGLNKLRGYISVE